MEKFDCMEGILDLQCKEAASHSPSGQFKSQSVKPQRDRCVFENDQLEWLFSRFSTKESTLVPQVTEHRQLVLFVSSEWVPSQADEIYQGEASTHDAIDSLGCSFTLLGPGQLSTHQCPQILLCSQTSIPSL